MFLHTYVLGVFICAAAALRFPLVAAVASLYAMYIMGLTRRRPLLGAAYCVAFLGPLAYAAVVLEALLEQQLDNSRAAAAGAGLAIVLGSFMLQLLGHCLHERFQAPLSLLHGFVAAPPLEWISFLLRCGFAGGVHDPVFGGIWEEVASARSGKSP